MPLPPPLPTTDAARGDFPQPFGRYTLLGRLGAGGMADALLAMLRGEHGFLKPVVIKRMHASLGHDSHFVKMFLDEARLAARLNHPNVVTTSEVGECDGHYFIAMEYLEGASLDRVARRYIQDGGGIPVGLLLRALCDCLEGLHYAHELRDFDGSPLSVVHRDVTPSNLFITTDGISKVLDFGIAKASTQDEATRTGMLKGKLAYMSPEQFQADPIDRRADLWSMGVVVWEMTTGRRLFKGANDAQTYHNIVGAEVPPVGEYRPEAPRALDAVIARALRRDRDARYPTAEAMRVELEAVLRDTPQAMSRAAVGAELRARFSDLLDEHRKVLGTFTRAQGRVSALPPAPAEVAPARDTIPPVPNDDEGDASTVVDEKIPDDLVAAAAAVVRRPATVPGVRAAVTSKLPSGPVAPPSTTLTPVSSPAFAAPVALPVAAPVAQIPTTGALVPFDPIPPEVAEARERAKREEARRARLRQALVQAVGWVTLLAILATLGALVYAQRGFIRRGITELAEGRPPDPARVGAFQLRITSAPSGARVFEGTHDHGPTPLELTVVRTQAADHPRQFRLELPGYTTVTAVQSNTLAPLAELRVTLLPANPRTAPAPPAAAPETSPLPTVVTTRRGHLHRHR